uniref:BZIP domain-containing protein n=1 Tax=Rhodosorus marinus TaxID=101924 RepID=A0A7S3AA30_9RHOD|mmetsp:Transcript_8750/g.38965  ORF Transcript_8750/g.38965 Transcript_8750/m.38965 type:complete len:303 (+) Transcript_8750:74-982(+)
MASEVDTKLPPISDITKLMERGDVDIGIGRSVSSSVSPVFEGKVAEPGKLFQTVPSLSKRISGSDSSGGNGSDIVSVDASEKEKKERYKRKNREYGKKFRDLQKKRIQELQSKIEDRDREIASRKKKVIEQELMLRRYGLGTDLSSVEGVVKLDHHSILPIKRPSVDRDMLLCAAENRLLAEEISSRKEKREVLLCVLNTDKDCQVKCYKSISSVFAKMEDEVKGSYVWETVHPNDRLALRILLRSFLEEKLVQPFRSAYRRESRQGSRENPTFVRVHARIDLVLDSTKTPVGFVIAEFLER